VVTKLQNADSQLDVTSLGFSFIFWSSPRNAFLDSLKSWFSLLSLFSLCFFRVLSRFSAFFAFAELRSATSFFRELACVTGLKEGVLEGEFLPEPERFSDDFTGAGADSTGDLEGEMGFGLVECLFRRDDIGRDRFELLTDLGIAWTFFISWKETIAGMECIPEGGLIEGLFDDDVVVGVFAPPPLGEPLSDLELGTDLDSVLGLSGFTLTWSRLVPKLLTEEGEDWRETLGWGIFNPYRLSSGVEIGLVNARVVIGDWVICAAAALRLTRLAAVLLM